MRVEYYLGLAHHDSVSFLGTKLLKRIAKEFQREIATPDEARKIFGLKGREPKK